MCGHPVPGVMIPSSLGNGPKHEYRNGPGSFKMPVWHESDMNREFDQNISCNEGYYTACYLLVMFKNSCSKLHCQTGFNLVLFSYRIAEGWGRAGSAGPEHQGGSLDVRASGPESEGLL
jgi:hypothetical protein